MIRSPSLKTNSPSPTLASHSRLPGVWSSPVFLTLSSTTPHLSDTCLCLGWHHCLYSGGPPHSPTRSLLHLQMPPPPWSLPWSHSQVFLQSLKEDCMGLNPGFWRTAAVCCYFSAFRFVIRKMGKMNTESWEFWQDSTSEMLSTVPSKQGEPRSHWIGLERKTKNECLFLLSWGNCPWWSVFLTLSSPLLSLNRWYFCQLTAGHFFQLRRKSEMKCMFINQNNPVR